VEYPKKSGPRLYIFTILKINNNNNPFFPLEIGGCDGSYLNHINLYKQFLFLKPLMVQHGLSNFFREYVNEKSLFENKAVLQPTYMPEQVLHREKEIELVASVLAPLLKGEKPSNLFVYGITGTGKTLTINYVSSYLLDIAKEQNRKLKIIYINCKLKRTADTEYRLIAQILRELGKDVPSTGLPTDEIYNIFYNILNSTKMMVLLVLDEIDQLIDKSGDEIIYNLVRINTELKESVVSLVGISNSTIFTEHLDPRVKSSLSEEEITFAPYNALQIQEILKKRAEHAFREGTIEQGVLEKCAAYAAREHGDARRAIELLRVAGEIAERKKKTTMQMSDLDEAEEKIEKEKVIEIIKTLPKQSQSALYCILLLYNESNNKINTGAIYDKYKEMCAVQDLRPLTQRRISDILAELDMLGVINATIVSKGRYGRTKEISIGLPAVMIEKIRNMLQEEFG
jgi:cell division control protein 6